MHKDVWLVVCCSGAKLQVNIWFKLNSVRTGWM